MIKKQLIIGFISLVLTQTIAADVPVYNVRQADDYLKTWLICGPFPNPETPDGRINVEDLPGFNTDYLKAHGGETNLKVQPGQVEKYDDGQAAWFQYTSDEPAIDLDKTIGDLNHVLAYACCYVEANQDGYHLMSLGSNDGIRVWVNGNEVWKFAGGRTVQLDDDLVPIHLKKGKNQILLKIENSEGQWGYALRILPFSGERFSNKRFFEVKLDGEKRIVPKKRENFLNRLFKRVEFRLKPATGKPGVVWSDMWPSVQPIIIDVDADRYREYTLQVDRYFIDDSHDFYSMLTGLGTVQRHMLFENGKTDFIIVVGEDASDSEKWAADELQHWLKEASGAHFPIVSDQKPLYEKEIILGINDHTKLILDDETPQLSPDDESFHIVNKGSRILIYGGRQRGTMYGVMDFLETYLGCRWYTPSVTIVPKKEWYEFSHIDKHESPGLRVRNDFYFEAFEPIWAARNRINGCMSYREQPGGVEGYWGVHTFYHFMPPDEFFEEHPEYFSLINGERRYVRAQLCLTNPDVLEIVTKRLKKFMRENPQYLIYSVSQNDWHGACQCEDCQKIAKREGSEAGPMLYFVNQVADAINEEFSDKFIGTLAYQYTRKAPKTIKPRENVVVRLCSIECCFSHSFYDGPTNQDFLRDLRQWAEIAPHLYIWDYVVNFRHYILPHPNFEVLQDNLQAFQNNKAIGVMEQACYNTRCGEFSELRAYVLAKLLWNPNLENVDAVIDDFMYGYYGRSGQYVRQYFDMIHGAITPKMHMHIFDGLERPLFEDDFILRSEKFFDRAEIVADNVEIRRRVQVARLPVMYLKLCTNLREAVKDGTYERFVEICKREKVDRVSERQSLSDFLKELEAEIAKMD